MTTIQPVGLSGTRYGVRIGSMAPADSLNKDPNFAIGQNPNWGQGPFPFFDQAFGGTAGVLPTWTAMPYLRPSTGFCFDIDPGDGLGRFASAKMQNPQDLLIPKAQAVNISTQQQHVAVYSLGVMSATGATIGPTSYGITLHSLAIDVSVECMLAGVDKYAYRASLLSGTPSTLVAGRANTGAGYSVINVYQPGPWITAAEMFSNSGLYTYLGARSDGDDVLGVSAYVNASLNHLAYSFSTTAGLTRVASLISSWGVDFSNSAINAWYTSPAAHKYRFRLTTPGTMLSSTPIGSTNDFGYYKANGGEFMALYGAGIAASGHSFYGLTAGDTDAPAGSPMLYQDPSAPSTLGGWGFLPPSQQMVLGSPPAGLGSVYMPAMSVGRDCFLDICFYNPIAQAWHWASADTFNGVPMGNQTGLTTDQGMAADSPTANWPGGLTRVQSFTIACASRASMTEEMGNRAPTGTVSQPPTVTGTFTVLETDADLIEHGLFQNAGGYISYTWDGTAITAVQANPMVVAGAPVNMVDYNSPVRFNLVLTVATPGSLRCAMMRFVVPNVRITQRAKSVQVNGLAARQFGFLCEDGGVATAAGLVTTGPAIATGFAAGGNLQINASAPAEGFGLKLGNNGGNTGGLAIQSFYIPAL